MPLVPFDNMFYCRDSLRLGCLALALLHCDLYLFAFGLQGLDLLFQLVNHAAQELPGLCLCLFFRVQFGGSRKPLFRVGLGLHGLLDCLESLHLLARGQHVVLSSGLAHEVLYDAPETPTVSISFRCSSNGALSLMSLLAAHVLI